LAAGKVDAALDVLAAEGALTFEQVAPDRAETIPNS
jgi:hypothetical protein